jgi:membrane fusion protein, multidrug efflux system
MKFGVGRYGTFWRAACALGMMAAAAEADDTSARGVVRAVTEATIAVDFTARITKLPVMEGASFRKGDVLAQFDCRRFVAETNAARAQARARELVMANNRKLLERGAIGGNEVKVSEAQFEEARANATALESKTTHCTLRAPFDGRMEERKAQEQESPAPNQPLFKIIDMSRLEIEAIIPSRWMMFVHEGDSFTFAIDETGATLSAKVTRLGAAIDPVSQTIKTYGVITDPQVSVLPGMSGTATFRSTGS